MTHNPDDLLTLWQPMLPLDRPFDLPPAWDGTPCRRRVKPMQETTGEN